MLKYRLKKIPKKKMIIWSTMIMIFIISLGSIVGFYAAGNPFPDAVNTTTGLSADGSTVIVNDLTADWNYYMGLNYSEIQNATDLPGIGSDNKSVKSTNKYNITSLVAVQINYNGGDINKDNLIGYVSGYNTNTRNEQQSKFTYYKYVPIENGKVNIQLIDNPFAKRPTGRGFNGWVCDSSAATNSVSCDQMTFSYDDEYYLRYLIINAPEADANGDKKLVINLKASWTFADIKTDADDIDDFNDKSMQNLKGEPVYEIEEVPETILSFKNGTTYYEVRTVYWNGNTSGCVNINRCNSMSCTCYYITSDNAINENKTYYVSSRAGGQTTYRPAVESDFVLVETGNMIEQATIVGYRFDFENNDLLTGYFYRVNNYNNTNKELHYNSSGIRCDKVNCPNGSTVYKLIQYTDDDSIKRWSETVNEDGTVTINTDYTKYYYFVTRDTNILDLSGNINSADINDKNMPFTVTSSHDYSAVNNNGFVVNTITVNTSISLRDDMVIENVIMDGPAISNSASHTGDTNITANYKNLKIGRTAVALSENMSATMVMGGGTVSSNNNNDKLGYTAVEGGTYQVFRILSGHSSGQNVKFQMGCDYDRARKNDSNLTVTYQAVSSTSGDLSMSDLLPPSEMIVKSGRIGTGISASHTSGQFSSYYMYGIYVGAHNNGSSTAYRTLKIEGGQIVSINGGPCIKTNHNGNVIGIYMTGGTVQNIVGGAGVSPTYGNRIISVTGGTVVNAVAGGSNSSASNRILGNTSPGPMYGSTLVYIGGTATIGGDLLYSDNSVSDMNKSLYYVEETGSVFGAGLGNNESSSRGIVGNSLVIINGGTVNGSVYGGGNYGAVSTTIDKDSYTLVNFINGTVNGSVYGGSNRNGFGYRYSSANYLQNDYYMRTTASNNGTISGNNNFYEDGSQIPNGTTCNRNFPNYSNRVCTFYTLVRKGTAYAANQSYYALNANQNGFVAVTPQYSISSSNLMTINMYDGTINSSLYGGSNNSGTIKSDIDINFYGGVINSTSSAVYGGGKGQPTVVNGNIFVNTSTSSDNIYINEIYGGSELGSVNTSNNTKTYIEVNGGNINNVYGGGKGDQTVSPINSGDISVSLVNGNVNNLFGGNNIRGVLDTNIDVSVSGGTVNKVYGGCDGSALTATNKDNMIRANNTNVSITGGVINNAVYGGGKNATTNGSSTVNISGGTFVNFDNDGNVLGIPAEVFGGGEAAKVTTTNVNIQNGALLYNVYGGSNVSGLVNQTNLNANAGEVLCNTYGGGKIAEVTTANSNLKGTEYTYKLKEDIGETAYTTNCGSAFGGGANANVGTANIRLAGSSIINVYGGSNEGGVVTRSNVLIRDGVVENVFGGNNAGGSTTNSYVDIDSSRLDINNDNMNDYTTPGNITVTNVFGGSNGINASISQNTTTNIYNGTISGDVFGGGNQAKVVGSTYVNMYGGTVTSLYGGGNRSFVGDANVNNLGVFVSGNNTGSTHVNVVNGTIKKNVYGSGNASFVYGTTTVNIGDTAKTALGINDSVRRNISIDGSVFAGSETNADKSTTYDDNYEGVTGPTGSGTGLIEIDGSSYVSNNSSTLTIDGSVYGSGNNSKVVNGSNIYIKKLGTKVNPVTLTSIQRAANVYITDSHMELNGSVDRADPNSYRYALIRIDGLYLLGSNQSNGTYLYLRQGSTFLKEFNSGVMNNGVFTPQKVTNTNGTLSVSVSDNRLYMLEDKVLSISDSPAPIYDTTTTKAGPVNGMTFLGMYNHEMGKSIVRGMYDYSYGNNSTYSTANTGSVSRSAYTFVYGLNLPNYTMDEQIVTHGFYTNVFVEDSGNTTEEEGNASDDGKKLKLDYVGVTPPNETTLYYKWLIGVEPIEIVVDLIADKYSESGAVNALITKEELKEVITNADGTESKQEWRDAIMTIQSVNTTGFGATSSDATQPFDGVLVDKSEIPTINTADNNNDGVIDANNYFALSMGTTSSGWLNNYKTNFYDENYLITDNNFCNTETGNCTGDQIYLYDSTTRQRNLSFWLYHSKNLDFSYIDKSLDPTNMLISMNQVKIEVEFRNPHGDPTSTDSTQLVTIVVNISLSDGELDKYGGVIAPGKQYEMFQSRPTTIASNGSFSIYQSLSLDLTKPIAGSATGERWDVGKIYHKDKTVEVTDAYGQTRLVEWSKSYRYLASSYLLPVGTVISMIDLKNNAQYYYEVTNANYAQKQNEFSGKNEYKYYLEDFIRMGSTTATNKFDDDMNEEDSKDFYYKDEHSKLAVEEFIFNVDFSGANVQVQNPDGDEHYFFLQLARKEFGEEKVIVSTNGSPRDEMVYTLKPQVSSQIETDGGYVQPDGSTEDQTIIYVGESTKLNLETSLIQLDANGNKLTGVSDTIFDEYKLGAKITVKRAKVDENNEIVYDQNGNVVYEDLTNDLFGTVMKINGKTYYPQTDGSTRIELAGRITDVISSIDIDFSNSSLTYGEYILVVETFVSYDGLYYGDFEPTYNEFPFELLNNQYGLDVKVDSSVQVIHDVNTGEDIEGNRKIKYNLDVVNGLANPNLRISLERRDYDLMYGTGYKSVPVSNLVESINFGDSNNNIMTLTNACTSLDISGDCYIYKLSDITKSIDISTYNVYLTLKNGPADSDLGALKPAAKWKSGTYRVNFALYDGDVEVGRVYEYLIIRSLGVDEIVIEGSGN